jgi:CRISPR-associated protein Cas2
VAGNYSRGVSDRLAWKRLAFLVSSLGTGAMRNTYLVCYDIRDDKRLRKVFKAMRNYGDHLQYSVFECQLTPIDLAKCQHELGEIIKHNEDQVLFVDLGTTEGRGERVITALGQPYTPLNAPCIVV